MANGAKGGVRFDIDWRKLERELGANVERAQKIVDTQVLKDSNVYVPRDEGDLERSSQTATVIGSGEVRWETPYAAAQYYGKPNKSRDVHPLATMRWFEAAKAANKAAWLRVIKKAGGRKR